MANVDFSHIYTDWNESARKIKTTPAEEPKTKSRKDIRVGVAYRSFLGAIQSFIPQAVLFTRESDIKKFDLIIFTGGEDINPGLYGESKNGTVYTNEERDSTEDYIFGLALKAKVPMFGICRGHQLIAALSGGSLFQDIAMEVRLPHGGTHKIKYEYPTDISSIYPQTVNSMHHQGVNKVPKGFNVVAQYNEVPEILESKRILTTQFHPEFSAQGQQFFDWLLEKWLPSTLKNNYEGDCSNAIWYMSRRKPNGDSEYSPRRPRTVEEFTQRARESFRTILSPYEQEFNAFTSDSTFSVGTTPQPENTIEGDTEEDEDNNEEENLSN